MSDKIGMNHTHIDFHKGTHGYPIKNADDMMKPCPLMPDGEWVYMKVEIEEVNSLYQPTKYKWTAIYNGQTYIFQDTELSLEDAHIRASVNVDMCAVILDNAHFHFGECRCAVVPSISGTGAVLMQGNTSWRISKITQMYYAVYQNNWLSVCEAGTVMEFWCYIIPTETGDE